MSEFVMPSLGADMEAGTLVAWLKQPGDRVARGDIIAEVDTDKGVIEVEVFSAGVVERLLVEPGTKVPVGMPLAVIRDEAAAVAAPPAPQRAAPVVAPPPSGPAPAPPVAALRPEPAAAGGSLHAPEVHRPAERLRISPSARRLARELSVEAASVRGTGPGGAVTREDIQRAARERIAAPAAPAVAPADASERMRQAIAVAMARSKREIPHYYVSHTIDFGPATAWLAEHNAVAPVDQRLIYGVLLLKAVALALREFPEHNALWRGDHAEPMQHIHVGAAISMRQGGLVAPALHDTDEKSLGELMQAFRDLVQRVRTGRMRSSELSDATITVTSLGERGVESLLPVIYPPQVAIVGFGKLVERPWVVDGRVLPRPLIHASLAADHRVSDGHRGALFLAAVDRILQQPENL